MADPYERVEGGLSPSDLTQAAFYVGRIGSKGLVEVAEVAVPNLVAADGSVRVMAASLLRLARRAAEEDSVILIRAAGKNGNQAEPTDELEPTVLAGGRVVIDHLGMDVVVDEEPKGLQRRPYQILELLAQQQGRVLTQKAIMKHVWGSTYVSSRIVDVNVGVIRKALGDELRDLIETRRGIGYIIPREKDQPEDSPVPPDPET